MESFLNSYNCMNSVVICFFQYHISEVHFPYILFQCISLPQFICFTIEGHFVHQTGPGQKNRNHRFEIDEIWSHWKTKKAKRESTNTMEVVELITRESSRAERIRGKRWDPTGRADSAKATSGLLLVPSTKKSHLESWFSEYRKKLKAGANFQ